MMNKFWEHNKTWLQWLGLGMVSFVLISSILRALTPPIEILPTPDIITTNKDGSVSQLNNIEYTGPTTNFPQELRVAQSSPQEEFEEYILDQLTKKYSLVERKNSPNYWIGPEYSLSKNKTENKYTLTLNSSAEKQTGSLSEEAVLQTAQKSINSLFPKMALTPVPHKSVLVQNLVEGDHDPLLEYSEAKIVVVPFTYMIDGYPVFYKNQDSFPFALAINTSYEIQKLEFNNFFIQLKTGNTLPLIPIETALENINNNQASIIYAVDREYQDFSKDTVTSGKMTSVSLEYRLDETTNIAYPFYRFIGTLTNKNGTVLEAEIITPAVEIANTP